MAAAGPSASPLAHRQAPWLALTGLGLLAFLVLTPCLVPLVWAGVLAAHAGDAAQLAGGTGQESA